MKKEQKNTPKGAKNKASELKHSIDFKMHPTNMIIDTNWDDFSKKIQNQPLPEKDTCRVVSYIAVIQEYTIKNIQK